MQEEWDSEQLRFQKQAILSRQKICKQAQTQAHKVQNCSCDILNDC